MADATSITELVSVLGGVAAACVVPLVLARRRSADDQTATAVRSWAELNEALQAEIKRVTGELERQRADYQRQLDGLRTDYQGQLDGARRRITELEAEVAALQRALRGAAP
jgi:predicted RNase H-like nuclease (RuvC/YqgF family)